MTQVPLPRWRCDDNDHHNTFKYYKWKQVKRPRSREFYKTKRPSFVEFSNPPTKSWQRRRWLCVDDEYIFDLWLKNLPIILTYWNCCIFIPQRYVSWVASSLVICANITFTFRFIWCNRMCLLLYKCVHWWNKYYWKKWWTANGAPRKSYRYFTIMMWCRSL